MTKDYVTPLDDFMDYMKSSMPPDKFEQFRETVQRELIDRAPVVAVIGKAGVGKTTTINSLFDVEDFTVEPMKIEDKGYIGDIRTGTTTAVKKRFELKAGISLDIIDLPGLGDDIRKDAIYEQYYRDVLPQCDIVLYILKADNRTLGEDERILQNIVLPHCPKDKLIIAINQVDLLGENEGLHWEDYVNLPNERQEKLIEDKQDSISKLFLEDLDIAVEKITCYSAIKRYHLLQLLESIVKTTPLGFIFAIMGVEPRNPGDLADPEALKIAQSFVNNKLNK